MHRSRWWSYFLILLLSGFPALGLLAQGINPPPAEPILLAAAKKKTRSRSRRRSRYTVPSYGNPTAKDSSEGEEQSVREVAAQALGKFNGSVAVVDADTGQILSIVNQGLAFSAGFKPCSTVKLAVALASLEEGLITGDTVLRVSPRQSLNLTEALAYSNNPFFETLGEKIGFDKVASYARLLGFGELAGYMIDDEHPGAFPSQPPAKGGVGRLSSFGEEIKVTPLQLAALMAALANGGKLFYLQYPRTETERDQFEPRIKRHLPIQRWLPELRAGMEAAVLYGTARVSAEAEEHILGKTGTCSGERAKLGWFASYGVLPTGERVVVVVLLRGGSALNGSKAAEIAGDVYRGLSATYVLAHQPDEPLPSTPTTGN